MSFKAQPVYTVNPLAGLSANEQKRILNELNSNTNTNTNTSSSFLVQNRPKKNLGPNVKEPVYAVNPYPGMNTSFFLNSNSNSNSNSSGKEKPFVLPTYTPSATGIAFKQAVLNRIKAKKAEEAAKKRVSNYPPVFAVNPYPGLSTQSWWNLSAKKSVSFSPNTKRRKNRNSKTLPKNCKTRRARH